MESKREKRRRRAGFRRGEIEGGRERERVW